MLTSLSFVFLLGLAMAALCQKFKIPRIIGMLVTGILLGPCVLNWLSESILGISSELRQMALIIILLKAGLSCFRRSVAGSCDPANGSADGDKIWNRPENSADDHGRCIL